MSNTRMSTNGSLRCERSTQAGKRCKNIILSHYTPADCGRHGKLARSDGVMATIHLSKEDYARLDKHSWCQVMSEGKACQQPPATHVRSSTGKIYNACIEHAESFINHCHDDGFMHSCDGMIDVCADENLRCVAHRSTWERNSYDGEVNADTQMSVTDRADIIKKEALAAGYIIQFDFDLERDKYRWQIVCKPPKDWLVDEGHAPDGPTLMDRAQHSVGRLRACEELMKQSADTEVPCRYCGLWMTGAGWGRRCSSHHSYDGKCYPSDWCDSESAKGTKTSV